MSEVKELYGKEYELLPDGMWLMEADAYESIDGGLEYVAWPRSHGAQAKSHCGIYWRLVRDVEDEGSDEDLRDVEGYVLVPIEMARAVYDELSPGMTGEPVRDMLRLFDVR